MPQIKQNVRIKDTKSHTRQQMAISLSSMCFSFTSSKLNAASVASELDYNDENASLGSHEIS